MDGNDAATEPPADPHDAARALGAFLAALHRPAPPDAPVHRFRGVPLADRDEIMRRDIGRLPSDVDADQVRAEWDAVLEVEPYAGPALWLHGDLHPANLVVRDGRLAGVVDFGDLTSGDPATDLMAAWSLLPLDAHDTFRAAAGGADDDTWRRARGWALTHAVACLASSADNPKIAGFSRRGLAAVLADR
jgi:aminoglycoside phosphotransferase (APT) family kinase protein